MPPAIIPYPGIANHEELFLHGHVFRSYPLKEPASNHGVLYNLIQTLNRYQPKLWKGVAVQITLGETQHVVEADESGHFHLQIPYRQEQVGWHTFQVQLKEHPSVCAEGTYRAAFGPGLAVVSDIDDTILISHSTRRLRKARLMLFYNALTRKLFPEAVGMFRSLAGTSLQGKDPLFFYVSSSEWNLFDFLEDLFLHQGLPSGVFFLEELKRGLWDALRSGEGDHLHKLHSIRFLLEFLPEKEFLLIGDNSQEDVNIYTTLGQEYPGRIRAVWIHEVLRRPEAFLERRREILDAKGIPLLGYKNYPDAMGLLEKLLP